LIPPPPLPHLRFTLLRDKFSFVAPSLAILLRWVSLKGFLIGAHWFHHLMDLVVAKY